MKVSLKLPELLSQNWGIFSPFMESQRSSSGCCLTDVILDMVIVKPLSVLSREKPCLLLLPFIVQLFCPFVSGSHVTKCSAKHENDHSGSRKLILHHATSCAEDMKITSGYQSQRAEGCPRMQAGCFFLSFFSCEQHVLKLRSNMVKQMEKCL